MNSGDFFTSILREQLLENFSMEDSTAMIWCKKHMQNQYVQYLTRFINKDGELEPTYKSFQEHEIETLNPYEFYFIFLVNKYAEYWTYFELRFNRLMKKATSVEQLYYRFRSESISNIYYERMGCYLGLFKRLLMKYDPDEFIESDRFGKIITANPEKATLSFSYFKDSLSLTYNLIQSPVGDWDNYKSTYKNMLNMLEEVQKREQEFQA